MWSADVVVNGPWSKSVYARKSTTILNEKATLEEYHWLTQCYITNENLTDCKTNRNAVLNEEILFYARRNKSIS
jgi:hypothetical protein